MDAAVHVGVVRFIIMAERIEHTGWFLGGGGIVQVDQGPSVHFLMKHREVPAHLFPIDAGGLLGGAGTDKTHGAVRHYIMPNCSFAASLIMSRFQGGSQTSST